MMRGMTDGGSDQRERLGRLIAERREELRLSVSQAAARARVDRGTWASAEAGNRQLARTKWRGIEDALQWAPGSIDNVLSDLGGPQPRPSMPAQPPRAGRRVDLPTEVRRIRALNISATDKIEMVAALIDLFTEAQADEQVG